SGGWPTYYALSTDPSYTLNCNQGQACTTVTSFHAPSAAVVQGNSPNQDPTCRDPNPLNCGPDRHYTIIDQTNHQEIDLWHAQVSPLGTNTPVPVGDAGYTLFDSGDGLAFGTSVADGANAGRYGNLAGRVRFEELKDAIAG